ncbi:MAG: carboxylesterase family protein [Ectothiorhodospiraceae bacterium]|nr:carboxylesterase family protein [Ectothiorhodospiraceae bacterium]
MIHRVINHPGRRSALLAVCAAPLLLPLSGCFSGSSSSSSSGSDTRTGTFGSVPVAGLNYEGSSTPAGLTDEQGRFNYSEGETITFSIGDLELGSAEGADEITALMLAGLTTSVVDAGGTNKLILLQTLDADGDLNNGIQLTETIRAEVSASAEDIDFDQPVNDFRSSLEPLVENLDTAGAFSDKDPRPRAIRSQSDAEELFARATSARVDVTTTGGDLRGFEANDRTWQFLGVPYARPPVGDLRWRPPELPESWAGVRDAVAWADQSAQDPNLEGINQGGMSEDSLYLNITAPKDASDLPVMVWLHGGSFAILSANSRMYNNPDSLTNEDVVLVTVNHRLGPFGYIAHPLLTAESGYGGSGNYGQMDLVMALQWVQDNIAAFGGDPGNVTIFGQSGGGGKVYSLMNSPQATGLFHKAIVQSAFAPLDEDSSPNDSLEASEAIGEALFDRTGVSTLEQARALPWTAFTQADQDNNIPRQTYRPNADFYYQPKTYYQNALDGMPSDVPLMAGVTDGDGLNHRLSMPVWLEQRSQTYQSNQYIYRFSRVPDGWADMGLRSCHGCELPYLFDHPAGMVQNFQLGLVRTPEGEIPEIEGDIFESMEYGADDVAIAQLMMTMWTNFAKTGDPGTENVDWPTYTISNDTYLEIGPGTEATVETGLENAME